MTRMTCFYTHYTYFSSAEPYDSVVEPDNISIFYHIVIELRIVLTIHFNKHNKDIISA